MRLDENGLVIMEQDSFPGSIGDSCAETSRLATLCKFNGRILLTHLDLFVTDKGVLRYPASPWRENDTSDDQVCPLIAAASLLNPPLAKKIVGQLESSGFKTGNGQFIHLSSFAQIARSQNFMEQSIFDLALVFQALCLISPVQLDPRTNLPSLSVNNSGNYLNFINQIVFAKLKGRLSIGCWLCTKIVSAKRAMTAVNSYYKPEPNNSLVVNEYAAAVPKIFR